MTTATLNYLKIHRIKMDWKTVCIYGLLICLPMLVLYVWQINNLTKGTYLINSYEKQISNLSKENRNLEVSFAENSFLGEALEKVKLLNFEKTTSVKYVQITDNSVGYNYKK